MIPRVLMTTNVLLSRKAGQDIWSKARITHNLRLVDRKIQYNIHRILFKVIEEFDEESTACRTNQLSLASKAKKIRRCAL